MVNGVRGTGPSRTGVSGGVRFARWFSGSMHLEGAAEVRALRGESVAIGDRTSVRDVEGIGGRVMGGIRISGSASPVTPFVRFAVGIDAQRATFSTVMITSEGEPGSPFEETDSAVGMFLESGLGVTVSVADWRLGAQVAVSLAAGESAFPVDTFEETGASLEAVLGLIVARSL